MKFVGLGFPLRLASKVFEIKDEIVLRVCFFNCEVYFIKLLEVLIKNENSELFARRIVDGTNDGVHLINAVVLWLVASFHIPKSNLDWFMKDGALWLLKFQIYFFYDSVVT